MNESTFRPGRVLVTGGASGLGAAVVDAVLKAGGTPVVLDRDIRNVAAAKAFEVDVSDRAAVTEAVRPGRRNAGRPGRGGHGSRN